MSTTLPFIKPSDAKAWADCKRRVWLDNKATLTIIPSQDPFEQLIIDHENTYWTPCQRRQQYKRLQAQKTPSV